MNKRFYLIIIALMCLLISSCDRKIVPAQSHTKEGKEYDALKFNTYYVEAIKQKLMGNSGDALKYFEQCININPDSDASYYQIAQILLANGDLNNGKGYAKIALQKDQENFWYLMMLAGIYYQESNLDSAIIYYDRAAGYYPEKESLQLTLGNLYSQTGNYSKASSIFNSLDEKFGVNESSTVSSVKNLMAEKNYDDALRKTMLLIEQYPDELLYKGLLAEIYRGKGEQDKAMEIYEQLIVKNPDNPQTQLSLSDFLVTEKNYDQLFMLLNSLLLNDKVSREDKISLIARLIDLPDLVSSNGNKLLIAIMVLEANYKDDQIIQLLRPELLIKQDKLGDATIRLEEIVALNPDNYYAWEKLLLLYYELKDYNKLMIKGKECATRFNRSFLAKILYANGALECNDYATALEELKKAEILAGDNRDFINQVFTMRAEVYYRMKDYDKAFGIFQQALKTNSDDLTVMNNYAYYLAEQDMNLKEAENMARKVIEKEKDNNTFLDTYGWVLYKRGKLKEAAEIMEKIINSGEKPDAEWYEHYGYILKKQKKCVKAVHNWEIALQLDKTKTGLIKEIEDCKK